ncbi:MAG: cupin domain-containing protein [Acidimicrobiia bacterium]|jgi:quercetin dioxygenase-like cupin family protein
MDFGRRVVTGPDGIVSDGPASLTVDIPGGVGVTELLWLGAPLRTVEDAYERTDAGFPLEPPPGGMSARIIRLPSTGEWLAVEGDDPTTPGLHATDTLDLVVVLDGEIVLGMGDDTESVLRAGDFVVQRGARHRWRVAGDAPCTYFVAMLRPGADGGPTPALTVTPGDGLRRLVTEGDSAVERATSVGLAAGGTRLDDVWHTGGPLAAVTQGGDPDGGWTLDLPPGGASFRCVEMPPGPPSDAGWHQTPTVDVDIVLSGRLGLDLPNGVTTELGPGDAVVQRGTDHRWYVVGDEPVRFVAVMLGTATA